MKINWDDVFKTGEASFPNTHEGRGKAIAVGVGGVANACMEKTPENYGKGMVAIGMFLGISATPDNLMAEADKWKAL